MVGIPVTTAYMWAAVVAVVLQCVVVAHRYVRQAAAAHAHQAVTLVAVHLPLPEEVAAAHVDNSRNI